MPLSCQDVVESFMDLLDDELAPDRRAGVEAHLDGCRGCATALETYRRTAEIAGTLRNPVVPAGVLADARSELDIGLAERAARGRRHPRWAPWVKLALSATVAAVGLVAIDRSGGPDRWQRFAAAVEGAHLEGSDGQRAELDPMPSAAELLALLTRPGAPPPRLPELDLGVDGYLPDGARSLPGGGLALRQSGPGPTITTAMAPGDAADLPGAGTRYAAGAVRLTLVGRGDLAHVWWHEHGVVCLAVARMQPDALAEIIARGLRGS